MMKNKNHRLITHSMPLGVKLTSRKAELLNLVENLKILASNSRRKRMSCGITMTQSIKLLRQMMKVIFQNQLRSKWEIFERRKEPSNKSTMRSIARLTKRTIWRMKSNKSQTRTSKEINLLISPERLIDWSKRPKTLLLQVLNTKHSSLPSRKPAPPCKLRAKVLKATPPPKLPTTLLRRSTRELKKRVSNSKRTTWELHTSLIDRPRWLHKSQRSLMSSQRRHTSLMSLTTWTESSLFSKWWNKPSIQMRSMLKKELTGSSTPASNQRRSFFGICSTA